MQREGMPGQAPARRRTPMRVPARRHAVAAVGRSAFLLACKSRSSSQPLLRGAQRRFVCELAGGATRRALVTQRGWLIRCDGGQAAGAGGQPSIRPPQPETASQAHPILSGPWIPRVSRSSIEPSSARPA